MNQRDITAAVLLRRNEELRRQRDAAVKDNQRLRVAQRGWRHSDGVTYRRLG